MWLLYIGVGMVAAIFVIAAAVVGYKFGFQAGVIEERIRAEEIFRNFIERMPE